MLRRQPGPEKDLLDRPDDAGVVDLAGGEIDLHRPEVRARGPVVPVTELAAGLLEHPGPDRDDHPALLRHRNETSRRDEARARLMPPDQRLEADRRGTVDLDHGLVVQGELVSLDGAMQGVFDGHPVENLEAHRLAEGHDTRSATALGAIHRGLGVGKQRRGVVHAEGVERDADRRAEEDLGPVDHEGSRQAPARTFDEGRCPHRRGTPVTDEEREELVSTEARDQLRFAGDPHQPLGHQGEEEIAGFVTHRVVDRLESIDVEQHHRDLAGGAPPGCDRSRQSRPETRSVGKTGQRIVQIVTGRSRGRVTVGGRESPLPRLLRRSALGDEAADGPLGSRPGREQAGLGDDPVPGLVDELEFPVRPAIAADPPVVTDIRERRDPELCRQHRLVHAPPDDFVAPPPEDAFGLRVPLGHHACGIDLDVGLGTERDQSPERVRLPP